MQISTYRERQRDRGTKTETETDAERDRETKPHTILTNIHAQAHTQRGRETET